MSSSERVHQRAVTITQATMHLQGHIVDKAVELSTRGNTLHVVDRVHPGIRVSSGQPEINHKRA